MEIEIQGTSIFGQPYLPVQLLGIDIASQRGSIIIAGLRMQRTHMHIIKINPYLFTFVPGGVQCGSVQRQGFFFSRLGRSERNRSPIGLCGLHHRFLFDLFRAGDKRCGCRENG